jgi:hypothetical protein
MSCNFSQDKGEIPITGMASNGKLKIHFKKDQKLSWTIQIGKDNFPLADNARYNYSETEYGFEIFYENLKDSIAIKDESKPNKFNRITVLPTEKGRAKIIIYKDYINKHFIDEYTEVDHDISLFDKKLVNLKDNYTKHEIELKNSDLDKYIYLVYSDSLLTSTNEQIKFLNHKDLTPPLLTQKRYLYQGKEIKAVEAKKLYTLIKSNEILAITYGFNQRPKSHIEKYVRDLDVENVEYLYFGTVEKFLQNGGLMTPKF